MYNEEVKKSFLEQVNDTVYGAAKQSFEEIEPLELQWNKDFGEFTRDETIQAINTMLITNVQTLKRRIKISGTYQSWYAEQTGKHWAPWPAIKKEEIDMTTAIRRTLYRSPTELLDTIGSVLPLDQGYYVIPALCLAWLGVTIKEAVALPREAVDLKLGIIHLADRDIKIEDPCLLQQLRLSANITVAYRTQHFTMEVKRIDYDKFLFKMKPSGHKRLSPITVTSITSEVVRLQERMTNVGLGKHSAAYSDVAKSGMLLKLYQAEQSGIDVFAPKNHDVLRQIFNVKGEVYDHLYVYRKYKEAFELD